ncbi:MAG TPA: energy transducer TonB [Sphingomicrobium sp.]|nr:energy transducer TonB [Sphingomicrobium sp.]
MRLGAFLACAATAPLIMAAAQPVRLQPSSPWVVDYGDESCHLIRTFGEGDSATTLMFEGYSPEKVDMLLIGAPLRTNYDEVSARFLPVQKNPQNGEVVQSATGKPAIFFSRIDLLPDEAEAKVDAQLRQLAAYPHVRPPATSLSDKLELQSQRQEFAASTAELEIDERAGEHVIIETGSLGQAIKAFDQCMQDSLQDWGVDTQTEAKITRRPWLSNVGKLISADDYPKEMLDQNQQSDVKARVLVDAAGRVTKCTSLSHFKLPQFNQVVCEKITRNAKFEPAELADGTKVASYDVIDIKFKIAQ